MIRLVIFDFDDTLIENVDLDYHSFAASSKKLNGYIPTKREIRHLRSNGLLAHEIMKWIKSKSHQSFDLGKFMKVRNEFLQSNASIKYLIPRPYVKKFLSKLKSMKIKMIIVSLRKKRYLIQCFLRKNGILNYFDEIFNAENNTVDTRRVRNATMIKSKLFQQVLSSYKIKPDEILSIGNSKVDRCTAAKYRINHVTIIKSHIYDKDKTTKIRSFNDLIKLMEKTSKLK